LLGKAQPYVKSEQGSLPLMPFYLFGCWNNYVWKEGGLGVRTGIFQGVRDICLPGSAFKTKRENRRFNQKLADNTSQRHIAKAITRNEACAGEGWDAGGEG